MRTAAILPVKRFVHAKQRLAASVADPLRAELAEAMVADVLLALGQARAIEQTILITGERSVAAAARERGAIVIEDAQEEGQPAAAKLGVKRALATGIERVLCVPGDCPTLDPRELDELLEIHPRTASAAQVVVVPDRHGTGTNGLLLAPADAIPPSFGPGSCERHRRLATEAGVACRVERVPSLLLDIDTGADLDVLRARLAGHPARAPSTRAVLGLSGRPDALSMTGSA